MMRRIAVLASITMLAVSSLVFASASYAGAEGAQFDDPALNDTPANQYVVPVGVCQVTIDAVGARAATARIPKETATAVSAVRASRRSR